MKQKIERMLLGQEKEGFFRKSGQMANYHKNLFLGLAYFHANLGGRLRFGTLGWHMPYDFDFSDFRISVMQLKKTMQAGVKEHSQLLTLKVLKYFITEINYAGRIHRAED